MMPHTAKN